jgi:hypothetical protein
MGVMAHWMSARQRDENRAVSAGEVTHHPDELDGQSAALPSGEGRATEGGDGGGSKHNLPEKVSSVHGDTPWLR